MSLPSPVSSFPSVSPLELPTPIPRPSTRTTHWQRPSVTVGVSGSEPQVPGNPLASAALYLYTFLATLILLVCVSLFIVIRSIVQRRRRSRAIRDAWFHHTNGLIPFREGDPDLIRFIELRMNQTATGRVDLGISKAPMMWEVHLAPSKLVDSEKTADGKLISSSWRSNQRSHPCLDIKHCPSPSWAWSSILPLSSTLLASDQATTSNMDGPTPGSVTLVTGTRRNLPLSSVRRFVGRMLYGSGSAPAATRPGVFDQSRATSASPITTLNAVELVDYGTPSSHNRNRTDADADADTTRLEEGTLHIRDSSGSGSGSSSQSHPHSSNSTNTSIDEMALITVTRTTTERAEASSTHPSDQQRVGEVHIIIPHKIPSNPQMRVAVLVRMPTPPTSLKPFPRSGVSNAESKAKAKAESGYEPKDEKRSSSSTFDDADADGVPPLEVGLADVGVDVFRGCQWGGGGGSVER